MWGQLVGGTASKLGGGKFANGAITGTYVVLFNHLGHDDPPKKKQVLSKDNETEPTFDEPDPFHLWNEHKEGKTAYVSDGNGNYKYYYPDGRVEVTTTSPGMMMLDDMVSVLLPELKGLSILKVPVFKGIGNFIKSFVPKLGTGSGLRIGLGTSRGREVFRVTYGERSKHFIDIDLGKIPKVN